MDYIKDEIFKGKEKLYSDLKELSEKIERISLKKKPVLIEFTGTCRSGKSSAIALISDVLLKNGLKVLVVDEEYVKEINEINHSRSKKMNVDSLTHTKKVIDEKIYIYDETCRSDYDIIIYDRGLNDEFVWLNIFEATSDEIDEYDKMLQKRGMDLLINMTCSVETSLKRKYLNSLSILPSKWTNKETLDKYLEGMKYSQKYFEKHSKIMYNIDTENQDKVEVALTIANKIIEVINEIK